MGCKAQLCYVHIFDKKNDVFFLMLRFVFSYVVLGFCIAGFEGVEIIEVYCRLGE